MKYHGTIQQVYSTNGAWSSIRVKLDNGRSIVASGTIMNPAIDFPITMKGQEIIHPKYGKQLKITESKIELDNSTAGMIAYLSSGLIKGIGEALATRIVKHFGKNTFEIIENNPDRLMEVPGIKKKKKDAIIAALGEQFLYRKLFELLSGKVTTNQVIKIIEQYGDDSEKIIKENPYQLIYDIDGFGFLKVDAIAKASGIAEDSDERVGAAIVYVLKQISEGEGHCYSLVEDLQERAIEVLLPLPKWASKKFAKNLNLALRDWTNEKEDFLKKNPVSKEELLELDSWVAKRNIIINRMADILITEHNNGHIVIDNERIYLAKIYNAETKLAEDVVAMCNKKPVKYISPEQIEEAISDVENEEGYSLEEEQKNAVRTCLKNRFSIITGGPGRGKTTIIRTILEAWGDDDTVLLCAPTGRASQKLKDSTGRPAGTIHRLVNRFLPSGLLVICDESSMLDIHLAHQLITNSTNCNVVLVGDVDQLAPIGPGSFFKDLVESPLIPTVRLIKGHRNHGSIAQNAATVNAGKRMKHFVFDKAFEFLPTEKEQVQQTVLEEYMKLREKYDEKDICVLSPMRARSQGGVNNINELIRNKVNPYNYKAPKLNGCKFKVGDRVMQTKNMNKKEVYLENGNTDVGIFNGDCGKVVDISPEDNMLHIVFDDGREAFYHKHETENLDYAYAMTVHKAQGSEYKAIIVIHNMEHYIMLRKNLLYTALTRAKEKVLLIGDKKAFDDAASNVAARVFGEIKRNTNLKNRMLLQQETLLKVV